MIVEARKARPVFRGLSWYRSRYFSFFVPSDWHSYRWPDDRQGVLYGPYPDDSSTLLAVELKDLGVAVTADDLTDLQTGFVSGIGRLPGSRLEDQDASVTGDLVMLEARYRFRDESAGRKRWVRVFYHETREISFIAQGEDNEYDYWLPMFFEALMTARVHTTRPQIRS